MKTIICEKCGIETDKTEGKPLCKKCHGILLKRMKKINMKKEAKRHGF